MQTAITFSESSAVSVATLRVSATFQTTIAEILKTQNNTVTLVVLCTRSSFFIALKILLTHDLQVPSTPLVTVPQTTTKPPTSSASFIPALSISSYIGAAAIAHKKFGLAAVASLAAALALAPSPSLAAVTGDHHFEVRICIYKGSRSNLPLPFRLKLFFQ